ncbi:MAG: TetR/AcrR family transcriptional regulator [Planctomycetes bacterium]|nr:TetR/AcrR family transcriptional regulator [Planctomycetota bacterium]
MTAPPKVDVRQRLVETAGRLFYAQGYQATGVNQIIDEADVCKASFYNHFPTKEDLLVAWLERIHNEATARVRSLLAQPLSGRDLVAEIFRFHEEQLSASAFRGCPFMNCLAEMPVADGRVRQVMHWHTSTMRQILEEIVGRATRDRNLPTEQIGTLSDDVEVVMQGGLTNARKAGDLKPLRHAKQMTLRILGLA